jgi:hypothetical protein
MQIKLLLILVAIYTNIVILVVIYHLVFLPICLAYEPHFIIRLVLKLLR